MSDLKECFFPPVFRVQFRLFVLLTKRYCSSGTTLIRSDNFGTQDEKGEMRVGGRRKRRQARTFHQICRHDEC